MQIQRVTISPLELVSLRELKAHMRIDYDVEDDLLRSLQRAAYDWVEQFTGRSLLTSKWKLLSLPLKGGSEIGQSLPFPNLLEVEDVFHVFDQSHKERERRYTIHQRHGVPYIHLISKGVPIEVLYSAGFGPHSSFVPEAFHHVIKVLVAFWHNNREGLNCGIPDTVELFLRQYQLRRLI
jgi:uncharacterized phiE125 gp8 family phage protein